MVLTNLGNRYEIKKYIKKLFKCIEKKEYVEGKKICEKLGFSLKRYNLSRGLDVKQYDEHISKLDYLLIYATNNRFKPEILFQQLEKLTLIIKSATDNPLQKVRDIHDEIRHYLMNINKESALAIIDAFDELSDLREYFEKKGGSSYSFYCNMMQAISNCEPLLLQVAKIDNPPMSLLSKLGDRFSYVFVAMQSVLSPPLKIPLKKEELIQHLKEGDSIENISIGYGQDQDDLRRMLQQEKLDGDEES